MSDGDPWLVDMCSSPLNFAMPTCHQQERCIGTFFAPDTLEGQEPQFKYPPNGPGSSLAVRKSGRNYFLAQKRAQQRLSLVLKCLRVYTSVGGRGGSRELFCAKSRPFLFFVF